MTNQRPLAVVLGASAGVGAAIAAALADDGFEAIGFYRGFHPPVSPLKYELIQADVGKDAEHVAAGIRLLPERPVQVLVHSLSGASVGTLLTQIPQKVDRTFNNLAHSFLWWAQGLYKTGRLGPSAHLIALSNPCPDFYLRNTGVIGAAKAALEAYVRMLAVELGKSCHVNAIRFGTVVTPALREVLSPEAVQRLATVHQRIVPRGRMQTAEDVTEFVRLLVQTRWINGAIVDLTGGAPSLLMDYTFNANL